MKWSFKNTSCIKSRAKAYTILGGPSLCNPKMDLMHYPWQNGSCQNCIPKVVGGKQNDCGLAKSLITLMGLIVHDHGDEKYAQYSNEIWPNDPNFTIGSLLWLLWTLEKVPTCESKMLFEHPPQNALFACLLQGKSYCITKLKTPNEGVGPKLLPNCFASNG
jgi:hypothetical protein